MRHLHVRAVDLPLASVHPHPSHARFLRETDADDQRLLESIRTFGLLKPLMVHKVAGAFAIVDGHRRYQCARILGMTILPCLVYPKLTGGDYEYLRFVLHDTVKPWTKS